MTLHRMFILHLPFGVDMLISLTELIVLAALLALFTVLIIKSVFIGVKGGREGLEGQTASVTDDFLDGTGRVMCMGELWRAKTAGMGGASLQKGERVRVVDSDGMTLIVERVTTDQIERQ